MGEEAAEEPSHLALAEQFESLNAAMGVEQRSFAVGEVEEVQLHPWVAMAEEPYELGEYLEPALGVVEEQVHDWVAEVLALHGVLRMEEGRQTWALVAFPPLVQVSSVAAVEVEGQYSRQHAVFLGEEEVD
jgi:hypothetical protein